MTYENEGQERRHAGLILPDLGLTDSQVEYLTKMFRNELIAILGGESDLARREVSLCEVTLVEKNGVVAAAPRPDKE